MVEYMKTFDDNSRFGIAIKGKNNGHVIVAEKKKGDIIFYDAQKGKVIENIDNHDIIELKLWQTDNAKSSDRGITSCESR